MPLLEQPDLAVDDELVEVRRRRTREARQAGLSIVEAALFADNGQDVGWLRLLVQHDCDPAVIARIML